MKSVIISCRSSVPAAAANSRICGLLLLGLLLAGAAGAQPARFVVDDQEFLDQVAAGARELQRAGKLVLVEKLQCQANRRYFAVPRVPVEAKKLEPPDLYDRLREST